MEQELNKYIGTDGIIEVQSRERSACKLLSTECTDHSVILNFESIFPVRELNFNDVPDWNIELSPTAFGKNFTFIVDGQIEEPDNNTIRFTDYRLWTKYLADALMKNYKHLEELGILMRVSRGVYMINPHLVTIDVNDKEEDVIKWNVERNKNELH